MNGLSPETEDALRDTRNLVQICVSATAYNLVSNASRIPEENRIDWMDIDNDAHRICPQISPGLKYFGLDAYLGRAQQLEWSRAKCSPMRVDQGGFEKLLPSKSSKSVDLILTLAVDYMTSIVKFWLQKKVSARNRPAEWARIRSELPKSHKKCWAALEKRLEGLNLRLWPDSGPVSETDAIIFDLLCDEKHFKVVRLATGEDSTDENGKRRTKKSAEDRWARSHFSDPIKSLLGKLDWHPFLFLCDFGDESPQSMLRDARYANVWTDLQSIQCTKSACLCKDFEYLTRKSKGKNPGLCKNCHHVHVNIQSYEVMRFFVPPSPLCRKPFFSFVF